MPGKGGANAQSSPLSSYPSLPHSVLGDLLWRSTPPTHPTGPSSLSSRGVELRGGEMQLAGGRLGGAVFCFDTQPLDSATWAMDVIPNPPSFPRSSGGPPCW